MGIWIVTFHSGFNVLGTYCVACFESPSDRTRYCDKISYPCARKSGEPDRGAYSLGQMYHSYPLLQDLWPIHTQRQSSDCRVTKMGSNLKNHNFQQQSIGLGQLPHAFCWCPASPHGVWTGTSTIAGAVRSVRLESVRERDPNHRGSGDERCPGQIVCGGFVC